MKLGTKQIVYGSILAAAAVAFGADRMFFAGETASASAVAPAPVVPAAHKAEAVLKESTAISKEPPAGWLAERLRAVSTADNSDRDVFAVPASWKPAVKPPAPVTATAAGVSADQFRRSHHLTGVILDGKGNRAVLDGRLVPLGARVDRFTLIDVSRQGARFAGEGEQASLALNESDDLH